VSTPNGEDELGEAVARAVRDCPAVGLVAIGPWTSVVAYHSWIADRLKFVLVQGRSPDDPADPDWDRVNCRFDAASCRAALDGLRHLAFAWVDLPAGGSAYPLDTDLVTRFTATPSARALRSVMQAEAQWQVQQLWDDSAALFLLRPDAFRRVGQHYEPAVSPAEMRKVFGSLIDGSRTGTPGR
jgi:hypothetical protein